VSTPATAGRAPVDVDADLTLTVEGQPISVESYTDLVRVDLPSVRVARTVLRSAGGTRRLDELDATLRTMDLTVDVAVDSVRVARLGALAEPQLPSVAPVEIDLAGAARAAVAAPLRLIS
jgi:hypothetical protein